MTKEDLDVFKPSMTTLVTIVGIIITTPTLQERGFTLSELMDGILGTPGVPDDVKNISALKLTATVQVLCDNQILIKQTTNRDTTSNKTRYMLNVSRGFLGTYEPPYQATENPITLEDGETLVRLFLVCRAGYTPFPIYTLSSTLGLSLPFVVSICSKLVESGIANRLLINDVEHIKLIPGANVVKLRA